MKIGSDMAEARGIGLRIAVIPACEPDEAVDCSSRGLDALEASHAITQDYWIVGSVLTVIAEAALLADNRRSRERAHADRAVGTLQ